MTTFEILDVVKIREGVTKYSNGKTMASWVPSSKLYVRECRGETTVVSTLKEGAITGTVWTKDLILVEKANKEEEKKPEVTTLPGTPSTGSEADQKVMWDFLVSKFENEYAAAGIMGNLYSECALRSSNLEQVYEKKLGFTDNTYTAAVDNGTYTNFVKDSAGYGLAQWTYWSRKENMLAFAKEAGKSIGDFQMQLDFLWYEMSTGFKSMTEKLKAATSVREASDLVLHTYEMPADQSEAVEIKRADHGQKYYDKFHIVVEPPVETPVEPPAEKVPETKPEEPKQEEQFSDNWIKQLLTRIFEFLLNLLKKE